VTGASVAEYTQNASQGMGMGMHFNVWVGNSSFGGTLDPSKRRWSRKIKSNAKGKGTPFKP